MNISKKITTLYRTHGEKNWNKIILTKKKLCNNKVKWQKSLFIGIFTKINLLISEIKSKALK